MADYKGQEIRLRVNLNFNENLNLFDPKKTQVSVMIKAGEVEKVAGTVILDPSKLFNDRLTEIRETFPLEKCPDKKATVELVLTLL